MSDRDEPLFNRGERRELWQTIALIFIGILVIIGASIALTWGRFTWGWATQPARLMDAQRVEGLSARMNAAHQGLIAADRAVETAQAKVNDYVKLYGEDTGTWPQGKRDEYQQDQRHLANAVNAYNQACGTYNAAYADEYTAMAAPDDLPKNCAFR